MAKKKLRKKILLIIILLILLLLILVITMKNLNSSTSKEMLNRLISGLDNLNYTYNDGEMDIHIVGKYGKGSTLETEKYIDYNDKITRELYSDHFMEEYQNNGFKDMEYYKEYIEYYFSNNMYPA